MMNKSIVNSLEKDGLSISPNYLNPLQLVELRVDLQSIQSQGFFRKAEIGSKLGMARNETIRNDQIYWLERESANATQAMLWQKLDELKQSLNRKLFLGLQSFEGHYASYPKGAFYKKHLDCFQKNQTRVISMALYLNENWEREDGGELRVFSVSGYRDIAPIGGTLVCFLSAESEHEVQPSHRERLSFTGWFRRDSPLR